MKISHARYRAIIIVVLKRTLFTYKTQGKKSVFISLLIEAINRNN